jgi:hypothetical protein
MVGGGLSREGERRRRGKLKTGSTPANHSKNLSGPRQIIKGFFKIRPNFALNVCKAK